MSIGDLLPWLNLLMIPALGYLMSIERRLTRLEALREADAHHEGRHYHRRATDPPP